MRTLFLLVFLAAFFRQYRTHERISKTVPTRFLASIHNNVIEDDDETGSPTAGRDTPMLMVCYYPWHGPSDLTPDQVETGICSHIITGFATVGNDGRVDPSGNIPIFKEVTALKEKQQGLKVLLSIGGGGGGGDISMAVRTKQSRKIFIDSIVALLSECGFDGVDIDWEFPGWNTPIQDKENFAIFLKEFREDVSNSSILLSVAVAAKLPIILSSYNVTALAQYTDFINLMTYGFHDYDALQDPFTGLNSPLYPRSVEKAYFATLNMEWAANYWVRIGMPREKIMVGLPTYAHTYTLENASMNGIDAPAVAGGIDWAYDQVCDLIKSGATVKFNEESLVPYTYKDLQWVSYENEKSITEKALWVKNQKFGGVMTFDLNADDWHRTCGDTMFPLHKIIHSIINN